MGISKLLDKADVKIIKTEVHKLLNAVPGTQVLRSIYYLICSIYCKCESSNELGVDKIWKIYTCCF